MSPIVAGSAVTVVCQTVAIVALWLRLRSKVALLRTHGLYIVDLARSLPAGSSLDEVRLDGSKTQLTVGSAADRCGHGRY